ncbi:MAG: permease [Hyphomicrobiaceae bacterium]|nr:permease [Hyphomicrobiaceae bacterium]
MTRPGTIAWFARHELLLVWRDWMSMMTAGRSARERIVAGFVVALIIGLHVLAYAVLKPVLAAGVVEDKATLVTLGSMAVLSFSLMLSQALESITRAFYSRADLDLILSSPVSAERLFAVRVGAIVLSTASLSLFLGAPFVNLAVALDGPRWLSAYPAILAISAIATAVSLLITVAMFKTLGPKHTRFVAQVVAAVVGAGFLIGTQVAAILYFGTYSRSALFSSDAFMAAMPDAGSGWWLPVKALLGDGAALLVLQLVGVAAIVGVVAVLAGGFGSWVVAAASVSETRRTDAKVRPFRAMNARQALRAKEWRLLARDPWLVSQSLMQLLYLIPPGVLLWQKFGDHGGALIILVPVLVMAVGQLAGGLAWLAISGEDSPDLVDTAPLPLGVVLFAKLEALLCVIAVVAAPFVIAIAFFNPWAALMTAMGVGLASASAVLIQLWHKTESRRTDFRRRQTASKAATLCEAFSSIMWAGTAVLAAAGMSAAAIFAGTAVAVLVVAWLISVRSAG